MQITKIKTIKYYIYKKIHPKHNVFMPIMVYFLYTDGTKMSVIRT